MKEEHVYRPIFKPLRSKFKPLGVPVSKFLAVIAVSLIGLGLAFLTGNITHNVEVKYTDAEYLTLTNDYENTYTALVNLEAQRDAQGVSDYALMKLTGAQQDTLSAAEEFGITTSMTKDQVDSMVPTTHFVSQPVIPDPVRFIGLVGLPFFIGIALFAEINSTSAYREIKRAIKWYQSPKVYKNHPIDYVERKTGKSYWEALDEANASFKAFN